MKPSRDKTFQVRANVISTFELMSTELDVPMDDLVNEALIAYARQRGYSTDEATRPPGPLAPPPPLIETRDAPQISPLDRAYAGEDEDDEFARTSTRGLMARRAAAGSALPTPGSHPGQVPGAGARFPERPGAALNRTAPLGPSASAPPALNRLPNPPPPRRPAELPSAGRVPVAPPPPPPRHAPPPLPRGGPIPTGPREPPRDVGGRRLLLVYRGRTFDVDKDRFLIGRSKTQADLLVDDPNVSRQHAAIERVGPVYYLVDLGSTNGVNVSGERVSRRPLADGDVITITSHEIRCSLR